VGNGDPSCHEPDKASERSAFNGLCMAIVQSKRGAPESIAVTVTSEGPGGGNRCGNVFAVVDPGHGVTSGTVARQVVGLFLSPP